MKSKEWKVEDGWIVSENSEMYPRMIISKKDFFGNIKVEITAQIVTLYIHDIMVLPMMKAKFLVGITALLMVIIFAPKLFKR